MSLTRLNVLLFEAKIQNFVNKVVGLRDINTSNIKTLKCPQSFGMVLIKRYLILRSNGIPKHCVVSEVVIG